MGMDPQQIYDNFNSQAKGTDSLSSGEQSAGQGGTQVTSVVEGLQRLGQKVGQGWKGKAADSASHAFTPVAAALQQNSDSLHELQQNQQSQATVFHSAKSRTVQMPPAPGFMDYVNAPADAAVALVTSHPSNVAQKQQAHNAAAQKNVDAMNYYVQGSGHHSTYSAAPTTFDKSAQVQISRNPGGGPGGGYTPPPRPRDPGNSSPAGVTPPPSSVAPPPGVHNPNGPSNIPNSSAPGHTGPGYQYGGYQPGQSGQPGQGYQPGQHSQPDYGYGHSGDPGGAHGYQVPQVGHYVPPGTSTANAGYPLQDGFSRTPGFEPGGFSGGSAGGSAGGFDANGMPIGGVGGIGGFGSDGERTGRGYGSGAFGEGGRSGGFGGEGGRSGSFGEGGSKSPGGGARSGVGSFPEEGVASGASAAERAAQGKPGMNGMAPGAAGRGKKEEDEEHSSPEYLRNNDLGDIITAGIPPTVPPVIE